MSKVIIVSRRFPSDHPRAGQPTHFVERIWSALIGVLPVGTIPPDHPEIDDERWQYLMNSFPQKLHTIRVGKRWKTGDCASLRVWTGEPYRSAQVAIGPDVQLTVKDIAIDRTGRITIDGVYLTEEQHDHLMKNDGLTPENFKAWFSKLPFSGQVLCFTDRKLPY